jgi:thiol-disulfide isomerase/thioredoxin
MPKVKVLDGDIERRLLHKDLLKEADSDEDGGAKTRVELDSDFSESEEEENPDLDKLAQDKAMQGTGENWSEVLTKHRGKHNTGAKGVKADYNEAKAIVKRRVRCRAVSWRGGGAHADVTWPARCLSLARALPLSCSFTLLLARSFAHALSPARSLARPPAHSARAQNETKRLQDLEAFKRAAYGSTTQDASVSWSATHAGGEAQHESEGSEDEEEFLSAFRSQRIAELRGFNQLPQFGRVLPVDKFQFLDEVDKADPRTFVVIHVYEDYIQACRRMNAVLDQVAAKHTHVKVIKLVATEASQTLSHRALPAFLVYRDQELVADSAVGVNEHTFGNDNFGVADVEWFLASHYGLPLMGVNATDQERGAEQAGAQAAETQQAAAWQSSTRHALNEVNLLSSRIGKLAGQAGDDDDWI